jgi:hypothetical protein
MPFTNEFGQQVYYPIDPQTEMMISNYDVSDVDVAMILNAWRYGEPQSFVKDPQQVKNTKKEWLTKAVDTGMDWLSKGYNFFYPGRGDLLLNAYKQARAQRQKQNN